MDTSSQARDLLSLVFVHAPFEPPITKTLLAIFLFTSHSSFIFELTLDSLEGGVVVER